MAAKTIQQAAARLAGLDSINPVPDLGPEITIEGFRALVAEGWVKLSLHNTRLAEADEAQSQLEACEKVIRDRFARLLAAVAAKFGRDSDQYEMAGGTRLSDRRRHKSKARTPDPS